MSNQSLDNGFGFPNDQKYPLLPQSKTGGKDQESIQLSTTPDPEYHMGKVTKTQLNITNKSQEVSHFPAGDIKAAMNRRESMKNTRHI